MNKEIKSLQIAEENFLNAKEALDLAHMNFRCVQEALDRAYKIELKHESITGIFGDPIDVYTRQQAIEDGVLVDVTPNFSDLVMLAESPVPVALTSTLYVRHVEVTEKNRRSGSTEERLSDLLLAVGVAIKSEKNKDQIFTICKLGSKVVKIKIVRGLDEAGENTITIMLPEED